MGQEGCPGGQCTGSVVVVFATASNRYEVMFGLQQMKCGGHTRKLYENIHPVEVTKVW